jgi:hypothetical protein
MRERVEAKLQAGIDLDSPDKRFARYDLQSEWFHARSETTFRKPAQAFFAEKLWLSN